MPGVQLKQINAQSREIQLFQANVSSALNSLQQGPFFGGNIVQAFLPASGATAVSHGLGRTPQFWIIMDIDTQAILWRASWDSTSLTLHASADTNVKLWIN
jgi:hypothetical protein